MFKLHLPKGILLILAAAIILSAAVFTMGFTPMPAPLLQGENPTDCTLTPDAPDCIQEGNPPFWEPMAEFLRLNWFDLLLPITVLAAVYLANTFGLANTGDRKRLFGLYAAVAVGALRVALLGFSASGGGFLDEYVQVLVMGLYAWLTAAGLYTGGEIIAEGRAALAKKGG